MILYFTPFTLQERMNVWVAMLNLEVSYGNEESLQKLFTRARENCDAEEISMKMVEIYLRNDSIQVCCFFFKFIRNKLSFFLCHFPDNFFSFSFAQLAEELLKTMVKKFKDSSRVWIALIRLKLRNDSHDEARQLLQRALQALPKRKRESKILQVYILFSFFVNYFRTIFIS
jgi:rRNA biogenesis protein RRP5